jgi:hypothetical protein
MPPLNRRSLGFAPPDFLWDLVALSHFMRPSLRKGAHAVSSGPASQEIRVGMTKGRVMGSLRAAAERVGGSGQIDFFVDGDSVGTDLGLDLMAVGVEDDLI